MSSVSFYAPTSIGNGHYEMKRGVCLSVRPSVCRVTLVLLLLAVRGPRGIPLKAS